MYPLPRDLHKSHYVAWEGETTVNVYQILRVAQACIHGSTAVTFGYVKLPRLTPGFTVIIS